METAVKIVAPPDGRSQVSVNKTLGFLLTLIVVTEKDRLTGGGVKTIFASSNLSQLYTASFVGGPRRTAIVPHPCLIKGHYHWLHAKTEQPFSLFLQLSFLPLSGVFSTLFFLPSFPPFFCSWSAWSEAKFFVANDFTSLCALNYNVM